MTWREVSFFGQQPPYERRYTWECLYCPVAGNEQPSQDAAEAVATEHIRRSHPEFWR